MSGYSGFSAISGYSGFSGAGGATGTTSYVSGSNFTTSSGSPTSITGLTFAATTNTLYEVEVVLKLQINGTSGLRVTMNFGAAGSSGEYLAIGNLATNVFGSGVAVLNASVATNFATTANADSIIIIRGIVTTTSSSGNLVAQIHSLSGTETITVYIGSRMTVRTLP